MNVNERIRALRNLMRDRDIDAYIVPTDDYHGSEYVGEYFKEREFITGFTGSAGTAVIRREEIDGAYLWVDGRYFLQADEQLAGTSITQMRMGEPNVPRLAEFLADTLPDGAVIGFDGRTVNQSVLDGINEASEKKGKHFSIISTDLIDAIWRERPALSHAAAFFYEDAFAGKTRKEKIEELKARVKAEKADILVITTLDDIAWLCNLRGSDVSCNPVLLSFFVMDAGRAVLFAQNAAMQNVAEELLNDGIEIREYDTVYEYIADHCSGRTVILNRKRASCEIIKASEKAGRIVDVPSYKLIPKHIKNPAEAEGMAYAHLKDGVAKTKWIYWLKQQAADGKSLALLDEIKVADKLFEFRKEQHNFAGNSFEPIMGYGPHGAIIHYEATDESASGLKPEHLLLADTGGQYLEGTTDVTRTIALGPLTEAEKRDYTAVLLGHLHLQNESFPYGTKGSELDAAARNPIRKLGLDYNHGTGHGVGVYLNVHEEPVRISKLGLTGSDDLVFEEGMITSNEPGIYVEGSHGIRIENLEICLKSEVRDGIQMMKFEPLTLVPYESAAVDTGMMDDREIAWYNEYQALVYEKLAPYLTEDEAEWLKNETRPLISKKGTGTFSKKGTGTF